MKIAVLGAGTFGCALTQTLLDNNHDVGLWSYKKITNSDLKENYCNYLDEKYIEKVYLISDAEIIKYDYILFVVPSFALRETAIRLKNYITNEKKIILCTKGIEESSLKTGYQVLKEEFSDNKICILSGPTHAEEIAKRKFSAIVATSDDEKLNVDVQKIFSNNQFRVYRNNDVLGVELAGAVKNILAIGAGFCDKSENLGDNAKAVLITRGTRELKILIQHFGGKKETAYGLTGLGDIIVTATSKYSRNRKFGELLGMGKNLNDAQKEVGMVVEGIYAAKAIQKLIEEKNLDLPIIKIICDVICLEKNPNEKIKEVMNRSLKSEE